MVTSVGVSRRCNKVLRHTVTTRFLGSHLELSYAFGGSFSGTIVAHGGSKSCKLTFKPRNYGQPCLVKAHRGTSKNQPNINPSLLNEG